MKRMMKLLGAALLLLAAGGILRGSEADTVAGAEGSALFLPASYEQYLALEKPVDVAMSDEYIAIADGASLYLYGRKTGVYTLYCHRVKEQEKEQDVNISKVQFTPDGRLFFSDADSHLFLYRFQDGAASMQENISCATFFIDGDTLYAASVTNTNTSLYAYDHRESEFDFSDAKRLGDISNSVKTPCLFVVGGELYSAADERVYRWRRGEDPTPLTLAGETSVRNLTSVAVYGDNIYYAVSGNGSGGDDDGIYRTVLNESSERILAGSGYNALTVYNGSLYCVKGNTVRELKEEDGKLVPTGYEIAASSDSVNRLSGATDTVRARDLLVTSDRGNERVSVCNLRTGEFNVLDTGAANCVATDGEVIAAAVGNKIKLYRRNENEPYYEHTAANNIKGLAVVFGRCYYVSEHHYGVAEEGGIEEFTRSNSPTALTNDVYGNLYVADQERNVTKYTEAEFLDASSKGTPAQYPDAEGKSEPLQLPEGYLSLRADFDGNLYYLHENALCRNGSRIKAADTKNYVYRKDDPSVPELVSFALGFEDNGIYLQYGDYIVLSDDVSFPTLSTIPSDGAQKEVFAPAPLEELSLVEVRSEATCIGVDAGNWDAESACFPYDGYARTAGATAVVLWRSDKFCLAALYENYEYRVALFRAEDCTDVVSLEREPMPPKTQYVTNEVALSYFPCLASALTIERLPRATEVTLCGTVNSAGFEFAYVRWGDKSGYLPLDYLTESSPLPPVSEEYYIGYLKASDEGVTFHSDAGDLLVRDEIEVRICEMSNGQCRVTFEKDGVGYYAEVPKNMLRTSNSDTLRIALIVVLSVIAVGIVAAYVLLLPRGKKNRPHITDGT